MGCVGSKKDQNSLDKGVGNNELNNPAHLALYVKDPTANSKCVSRPERCCSHLFV